MPSKKKKYITYDYEAAFPYELENEDQENLIRYMLRTGQLPSTYAVKEITSGGMFEVEIYPEFTKVKQVPETGIKKNNQKAQRNLNDKNARKYFIRLLNTNFTTNDIVLHLEYSEKKRPKTIEQAKKIMGNYIKRINRLRKKHGLENARYVYITECEEEEIREGKRVQRKVNIHHHLIMDGELGRDLPESKWKHGGRNRARYLVPDDYELTGLAKYLSKAPKGEKRWCASTNLEKPKEKVNHYKFKKKHVEEMFWNQNTIELYMGDRYPEFRFLDAKVYHNNYNAGYYITARMRKRGEPGCIKSPYT